MELLELIKKRTTTRRYLRKKVPRIALNTIIEAGIWGPSIHHFQPWKFLIITNKSIIKKIAFALKREAVQLYAGYNILMGVSSKTISEANVVIAVVNTKALQKRMNKFGKSYTKCARLSEVQAISASIQNMILIAEGLGIGSAWLVMPTFCSSRITGLLKTKHDLVALLTLGHKNEIGKRSPRKILSETVEEIK